MKSIKTSILAVAFCIAGFFGLSQNNPLQSIYEKYQGLDGYYFLTLNTNMFGNASTDEENQRSFQDEIEIIIVSCDDKIGQKGRAETLYEEFQNGLDKEKYKGLIEVRSKGDNVEFLVKKQNEKISEILILVREKDETTLISASGNFDMADLTKFTNLKGCKGLEILGKICDE